MATKTVPSVTLLTPVEHAVLARWFNVEPPTEASDIDPDAAVAELRFTDQPGAIYTLLDAAVA